MLIAFVAYACSPESKGQNAGSLTPQEFKASISDQVVLLDVRTKEEFDKGAIAGAVNIDYRSPDFAARVDSLDKSKTYLLYCASGVRSGKAADVMKRNGFTSIVTLDGGTEAWKAAGFTLQTGN